ncbi:A1S_2505 family phage non-structural protein [Acinetobacter larvae]|uniref:Uncharacterized protein n=1 Tax=Acinetobacter larvae TaxID=1789224 RepID=A0A1B2M0E5_9GAMM|nr:hypothetical protein [Acinetobacter larvae]AOA58639.1 hypothetical protein BFG52_09930 [Acinetobacter larvae]
MSYQYHDETIIRHLASNTFFVFGSNLAGTHAGGAAKIALQHFGASKGVGRGWAGQSFAIPTMNEHLQQMPLSQIQHYIDDFKTYVQHHPHITFFITAVGCGVAGYKVAEIAPMFKGIAHNVIFPESFRPFVAKTLPRLTQKLLYSFIQPEIVLNTDPEAAIEQLPLSAAEKSFVRIILNTPMYPIDSNGRDRVYEIEDILYTLKEDFIDFPAHSTEALSFGGVVLAILELYGINERDFLKVWLGQQQIAAPAAQNHAKPS